MDPILPLLAGLGGTLLGGVIAYFNSSIQWNRQLAASRKQALSAKLEQICELVIDIQFGLMIAWAETLQRIIGSSSPTGKIKDEKRIPLERLDMLVLLYFESLIPHAKAVIDARNLLGEHAAASITSPRSDPAERKQAQEEAHAAYKSVEKACDDFLAEASKIAKSLL